MSSSTTVQSFPVPAVTAVWQRRALWIGIAFGIATVVGFFVEPHQFFSSYLLGYMITFNVMLGCMALLMVQYASGGQWGVVIRRPAEAATRTLPLMIVLFVPIALGMKQLYPWAVPAIAEHDKLIQAKAYWLNSTGWLVRAAVYFACWALLAYFLNRWSRMQDEAYTHERRRALSNLSGAGMVIYGLTLTFASVDWLMSLLPHWYSTMFGLIILAAEAIASLSFLIILLAWMAKASPAQAYARRDHYHDLGNLLLASIMLWAYFGFSQWLITWAGDLPDEIVFYLSRSYHGWQWVAGIGLFGFDFAIPFLLLLSRSLKRQPMKLALLGIGLLVMRWWDLLWIIRPNYFYYHAPPGAHVLAFSWTDITAPLAIAGLWVAYFFHEYRKGTMLPLRDPLLAKVLIHHPGKEASAH
jgi:hypothetical protein